MTTSERARLIQSVFEDTIRVHDHAMKQDLTPVLAAVDAMAAVFARGGKLLVFGNGGSAADSQHLAAELVGRFMRERRALPAIALSTDTSVLTGIGNDYSYDRVFARQIEALGRPGDLAIGISTSGGSRNVLDALAAAKRGGLTRVALTGRDGGAIGREADIHINVPEPSTARVQEVHRTLLHAMCELIERELES